MATINTTFGQFPPFNDQSDHWTIYAERLDHFFLANGVKERTVIAGSLTATTDGEHNNAVQEQKRAVLLTVIGTPTYTLLRSIIAPRKPNEETYTHIIDVLSKHFNPTPTEIVESTKFFQRTRREDESESEYMAALRKLAEFCNYGSFLNRLLRDRFVSGINNDQLHRRLLDIKEIDVDKALKVAVAFETVERDIQEFKGMKNNPSDVSTNRITNQFRPPSTQGDHSNTQRSHRHPTNAQRIRTYNACIRCTSTEHPEWECPYKTYQCHDCKTAGHLSKACRKKTQHRYIDNKRTSTSSRPKRTTHANYIDEATHHGTNRQITRDTEQYSPEYDIFTIFDHSSTHEYIDTVSTNSRRRTIKLTETVPPAEMITCIVNQIPVTFQVDTGSGYTIISETVLRQLHHHAKLSPGPNNLAAYTGHLLDIKGQLAVDVTYQGKTLKLPLVIDGGNRPNLMGRNWIYSEFNILPKLDDQVHHITSPRTALHDLLKKHAPLFSPGMGCIKNTRVKLHVKKDAPIPRFHKARSVPYHLKDQIEKEIRRLESEGIISPITHADFATPIVPIMKKDKSIRICGDFKVTTNKVIDTECYPLPKVDDIFAKLAGSNIFARLDMRNAYNQLELDEASRNLVVINTTKGLYRYNRLPFGISSASAIFQRYMEVLLQDHPSTHPFQDDIIVGGTNEQDLIAKLSKIFQTFEREGIKLNQEKCEFLKSSINFLGYRLDTHGLHPQLEKLAAIRHAPAPKNVEELRSFLGLINYYARFIPNASTLLSCLYSLLNKAAEWQWSKVHQDAFEVAKKTLESTNLLVLFDPAKEVILACDASPAGVGAVISHNVQGVERPIAFASRTLSSAEKNYPQIEREALSIIFGVTRFREYLLGKQFVLVTDHKPLVVLFSENKTIPQMAAARLQRWALMLSAYDYRIVHKKGSQNGNADALSRLPMKIQNTEPPPPMEMVLLTCEKNNPPINILELATHTQADAVLNKVLKYTLNGWPRNIAKLHDDLRTYARRSTEISTLQGILVIGNKVIVPSTLRRKVINELHSTHQGLRSMKELARAKVWWPAIDQDLTTVSKNCETCRIHAPMPPKQFAPWQKETAPWRRVHVDFAGPIENRYLLITVDAFSKWIEIDITASTSSAAVIQCLRQHMTRFGIMQTLVSDNATCFTSDEFKNFMTNNGVRHITTAPYHPASNGQAERSVRTVKTTLKKITGGTTPATEVIDNGLKHYPSGTLEVRIAGLLLNYRRTPLNGKPSPAEKMFKRPITTKLDLFNPNHIKPSSTCINDYVPANSFQSGQPVQARNYGKGQPWIPGTIIKRQGHVMYQIETSLGVIRRHKNQIRSDVNTYAQPLPTHGTRSAQPEKYPLQPTLVFPRRYASTATPTAQSQESIVMLPAACARTPHSNTPQTTTPDYGSTTEPHDSNVRRSQRTRPPRQFLGV